MISIRLCSRHFVNALSMVYGCQLLRVFRRLVFIAFKELCLPRYTLSGRPVKRTGFQSASVSSADSTAATSTKSATSNGKVASNGQVANGKDGNVDGNGNKVDGSQNCPDGWAMSWDESCQRYYYWQVPWEIVFHCVVGENGDRGRLMKALFLKDWAFLFFGTLLTAIHSGNLGRRFPTCHCSSIIQHLILAYSSSIFSPLALPPTSTFEGSLEILTSLPSSHFDSHLSNPFHMTFCPKVSDRSKTQWEHPSETPAKPSKPARPAPSASAGSGGTKMATTQSSLPPKGWGYS